MIIINYTPVEFPNIFGPALHSEGQLRVQWSDIVRSAITVGRKNWLHVIQHEKYAYFEIIYRAAMIYANLKHKRNTTWSIDSPLIRTEAYADLDPSEKSAISYFLGLTASKLFSEKLLNVPWLMHLDIYGTKLNVKTDSSHRPDLIGVDQEGRWIVIESKGRSNSLDKKKCDAQSQKTSPILNRNSGTKPLSKRRNCELF